MYTEGFCDKERLSIEIRIFYIYPNDSFLFFSRLDVQRGLASGRLGGLRDGAALRSEGQLRDARAGQQGTVRGLFFGQQVQGAEHRRLGPTRRYRTNYSHCS